MDAHSSTPPPPRPTLANAAAMDLVSRGILRSKTRGWMGAKGVGAARVRNAKQSEAPMWSGNCLCMCVCLCDLFRRGVFCYVLFFLLLFSPEQLTVFDLHQGSQPHSLRSFVHLLIIHKSTRNVHGGHTSNLIWLITVYIYLSCSLGRSLSLSTLQAYHFIIDGII